MKCWAAILILVFVGGCSSKPPSSRYIINSIKAADLDNSKTISRNEFKMYFQGRFSQIDPGDTGRVAATNLCPGILPQRYCEDADANKDGFISIDELYERLDREFTRVSHGKGAELTYKEFHQALLP